MSSFLKEPEVQGRPRIVVELPELRASGGLLSRNVMTYAVCVHGAGDGYPKNGVRHRYSDFEALATRLQRRFGAEGMLVPPLPPKKLVGNTDLDFIKSRTNGLQLFVDGIAASPFLFQDLVTHQFLTRETEAGGSIAELLDAVDDGAAAAALEARPSSVANPGYVKLTEFLSAFSLPPDPDALLDKMRVELDVCERVLKDVLEGCKALQAGFGQYTTGLQAFSHSLHVLAEGERSVDLLNQLGTELDVKTYYDNKKGEEPIASSSKSKKKKEDDEDAAPPVTSIPLLAAQTADLYAATTQGYLATPDQTAFFFSAILEYELGNLHGLKALLAAREDMHVAIQKLQKKVEALKHAGPSAQSNRELQETRLDKEEVHYYKHTKALLCFTIPLVAAQRTRNLNRAVARLAAISTAAAAGAFTHAQAYLEILQWDPVELVDEANEAGAALVVPPIPSFGLTAPLAPPSSSSSAASSSPKKRRAAAAAAVPQAGPRELLERKGLAHQSTSWGRGREGEGLEPIACHGLGYDGGLLVVRLGGWEAADLGERRRGGQPV